MKRITFYLLFAIIFSSCKKEKVENFQPIFQFSIDGVAKSIHFDNNFLTIGYLNFIITGDTRLALTLVSNDRSIELGFSLNMPDAYWIYNLGSINNSESRAYLVQNTNSVAKYYTGGGRV